MQELDLTAEEARASEAAGGGIVERDPVADEIDPAAVDGGAVDDSTIDDPGEHGPLGDF